MPGNPDALFLPAGKLRRVGLVLLLQAHQFQQFTDFAITLIPGHARHFQWQLNVLPNRLGRHQIEVLEDHPDPPPQRHQAVFIELADVHLIDQHPPGARLFEAIDGANQRRLAGAAAADDAEHFATLDRQINAMQCRYRALLTLVGFTQADEAHMGAVQVRVQFRLFGVLRLWNIQSPLAGGRHVQLSQPA